MSQPAFQPIETPRLRLRPFSEADLPTFLAYRNDPEVARYQSWVRTSETEARAFIEEQKTLKLGAPGEWIQIAIELKATRKHIGDLALHVSATELGRAELGYTLDRAYHGQGYATEAVLAILAYVFETIGVQRVTALVDCANDRSIALLERVGMQREELRENVWFKGRMTDEYLYGIQHDAWLRTNGAGAS